VVCRYLPRRQNALEVLKAMANWETEIGGFANYCTWIVSAIWGVG